jgi:hypothetical protein
MCRSVEPQEMHPQVSDLRRFPEVLGWRRCFPSEFRSAHPRRKAALPESKLDHEIWHFSQGFKIKVDGLQVKAFNSSEISQRREVKHCAEGIKLSDGNSLNGVRSEIAMLSRLRPVIAAGNCGNCVRARNRRRSVALTSTQLSERRDVSY